MSWLRVRIEDGDVEAWITGAPDEHHRYVMPVNDSQVEITRNMQSVQGSDFRMRIVYDRGNQEVSRSFTHHREFASDFARMAFIALLAPTSEADDLHPWEGNVFLRVEKADVWMEWELPNAALMLVGVKESGQIGLDLDYKITAPGINAAAVSGVYTWFEDAEGDALMDIETRRLAPVESDY